MQFLADEGLIVPDALDPVSDLLTLDFTQVSSRAIGAIHSRYAVRHAHAIYVLARHAAQLAELRRGLRVEQAKFRARRSGDFKEKWRLESAMAESKRIGKIERAISELEIKVDLIDAVARGYEDFRNAASREMFRRGSEQAPRD